MNLSSVIASLASGSYTVSRAASGGTLTNGRYTAASRTPLTIVASIQPSTGRDLDRLPEGFRTKEAVTIFTATPLQTADESAGTLADFVTYGSSVYEVQTVMNWSALGAYYKAIATRTDYTTASLNSGGAGGF